MKTIFIIMILLLSSMCYAVTVGELTGFDYGIIVGGKTGLTTSEYEIPNTYWYATYTSTSDWNTAYGADWNLPYSTEIP